MGRLLGLFQASDSVSNNSSFELALLLLAASKDFASCTACCTSSARPSTSESSARLSSLSSALCDDSIISLAALILPLVSLIESSSPARLAPTSFNRLPRSSSVISPLSNCDTISDTEALSTLSLVFTACLTFSVLAFFLSIFCLFCINFNGSSVNSLSLLLNSFLAPSNLNVSTTLLSASP